MVAFTTNIGLAKPTESELANNWINGTQLQSDNNIIIQDKMAIGLASYTPVIIGQTTNPSLGIGSCNGEYQDIEGYIQGSFIVKFFDAGVTSGSGEYGISLPLPVDGAFHTVGTALNQNIGDKSCIGEGYFFDNSAGATSGSFALDVVTIAGVSYVRMCPGTFAGKTSRLVRDAMPAAMANNDKIGGSFFYKKA